MHNYILEKKQLNNYLIFCDPMSTLQMIQTSNRNYTQRINIIQRLVLELKKNRDAKLHWIRGHIDITGYIIADKTANMGHQQNKLYLTYISREEQLVELIYLYKIIFGKILERSKFNSKRKKYN